MQISNLEKERAVLEEKLTNLETKYQKEVSGSKDDIESKSKQISEIQAQYQVKEQALKQEIQEKTTTIHDLDRQVSEIQSWYDKDNALWEGKFKFLTEQKEQLSKLMAENQAKFEESIKQLQGDKSNVKEVNSLELLNAEDQKHKE